MFIRAMCFAPALIGLVLLGSGGTAAALEKCIVADPQDPTLNVRATPRGELLGSLKNGHPVYVLERDDVHYGGDKYRTWSHIVVEAKGTLRPFGWVFEDYIKCKTNAPADGRYPLYVGPGLERDSETIGFAIDGYMKPETNLCYYYGDGGVTVSVSDKVLRSFEARGFSLNSLCLGLISDFVLFDPETGRRLPSMVHVDLDGIEKFFQCDAERHETVPPGCEYLMDEMDLIEAMSKESLIDLPDCFKGGTPYADCTMNYDMATGRKIGEAERNYLRAQGQQIDALIGKAIAQGVACRWEEECDKELDGRSRGGLDGLFVADLLIENDGTASAIADTLQGVPNFMDVTAYDVAPVFPKGFGYAIGADGAAAPTANLQSAKLALDQKTRSTRAKIEAVPDRSESE